MDENQILDAFVSSMEPAEAPQPEANPKPEAAQVEGADAPQEEVKEKVEAAAEEEQETQTIEIDPDEPLFEQEVEEDGKKVAQKLSLKELQQGYLRERDYRRKTQELARQREELPKVVAKQGQELSASYEKRLSELSAFVTKAVAADLQGKDLNQLAESGDMYEYVRVSNRMRQIQELQQAIQKEQDIEAAKRKEEEQRDAAEKWQKSLEVLNRDIPEFGPATVKRLIETGEEWGFSRDEVSGWNDHRYIKMLYALSEQKTAEKTAQAKKPVVEKKVAVTTKVLKPGQPAKSRNQLDEAKAKLRKSGKPEDAVSIFEAML